MFRFLFAYLMLLSPCLLGAVLQNLVHPFFPRQRWIFLCFVTFLHYLGFWIGIIFTIVVCQNYYGAVASDQAILVSTSIVAGVLAVLVAAAIDSFQNKWDDTVFSAHIWGASIACLLLALLTFYSSSDSEVTLEGNGKYLASLSCTSPRVG